MSHEFSLLCCAVPCCATMACYGVMCSVTVAYNARCQGAVSDTLGHYHNGSRPHAVHVWLVQGLLVEVCSGESAVLGGEAVQQGIHAFLTNSPPHATPNAPPLRVRTLCWVRHHSASCYISLTHFNLDGAHAYDAAAKSGLPPCMLPHKCMTQ